VVKLCAGHAKRSLMFVVAGALLDHGTKPSLKTLSIFVTSRSA